MSKNTVINEFMRLTKIGLSKVTDNIDVIKEDNCVVVRHCIVDFDNGINIYNAYLPEHPFMTFPIDAVSNAATFVCLNIVDGLISRIIEDSEAP